MESDLNAKCPSRIEIRWSTLLAGLYCFPLEHHLPHEPIGKRLTYAAVPSVRYARLLAAREPTGITQILSILYLQQW